MTKVGDYVALSIDVPMWSLRKDQIGIVLGVKGDHCTVHFGDRVFNGLPSEKIRALTTNELEQVEEMPIAQLRGRLTLKIAGR